MTDDSSHLSCFNPSFSPLITSYAVVDPTPVRHRILQRPSTPGLGPLGRPNSCPKRVAFQVLGGVSVGPRGDDHHSSRGVGAGFRYLMESVAAGHAGVTPGSGLTRYYAESSTPPGVFLGFGLAGLGGGRGIEEAKR
jgi:hypothetical protein